MTKAVGRALDLEMFNNAEPYLLINRLKKAAQVIKGAKLVEGDYLAFEDEDAAGGVAAHVNNRLPADATVRLSGPALWDLALFTPDP